MGEDFRCGKVISIMGIKAEVYHNLIVIKAFPGHIPGFCIQIWKLRKSYVCSSKSFSQI